MTTQKKQGETWSVRKVIAWVTQDLEERGIESARLDAELLVAHALGKKRIDLYLDLEQPLAKDELSKIRELIQRRRTREPIAYILGRREFYGRSFAVTPDVLIPRPDTETLVETTLAFLRQTTQTGERTARVLDIGTGSGAIAITLACEIPNLWVDAVDISEDALRVAQKNAEELGATPRMQFYCSNLTSDLPSEQLYSVVVSNPPYIVQADVEGLEPDIRDFEPQLALDGGKDGLDYYRRLAEETPKLLEPSGHIILEVGFGQAQDVANILADSGTFEVVSVVKDLGGIERVVEARCTANK